VSSEFLAKMDLDEAESMDNEVEMEEDEMEEEEQEEEGLPGVKAPARRVYLPGQPIQSDEQLECDETAYILLHQAKTG
jgi:hypothetical protein